MSILTLKNPFIKNPSVFDLDLTPPEIFLKPEANEVLNYFKGVVNHDCPNYTQLVGPTGTGKTTTIRHYLKVVKESEFKETIDIAYVSCKDHETPFKCFKAIIENLNGGKVGPIENSLSEIFDVLSKKINRKCLIVLDEIDLLKNINAVLYRLVRFNGLKENLNSVSLVLISNTRFWEKALDAPTQSSLSGMKPIYFRDYEPSQLTEILKRRAIDGLVQGVYNPQILEYISAKTVKEKRGDARIAINALHEAAKYSENLNKFNIEEEDVDEVFEWALEGMDAHCVKKLEDKYIKVLYACLQSIGKSKTNSFQTYSLLFNDLKKSAFYNALNYLRNLQIILPIKIKDKIHFEEVELQVDGQYILKELEDRDLKVEIRNEKKY